jgi:serine/threonine protein kinase
LKETLEALECMKQRRCCHLDVKPANFIITETNNIKAIDFGISTKLPPNKSKANLDYGGTPLFMAPEIENLANAQENNELDPW